MCRSPNCRCRRHGGSRSLLHPLPRAHRGQSDPPPARRRILFLLLLVAAFMLTGLEGSFAQEVIRPPQSPQTPRDDVDVAARALLRAELALGPLLLRPQIGGAAGWRSISEGYRIGDPTKLETDFVVDVSPEIQAALSSRGRHLLKFGARLNYHWFARHTWLRKLDIIAPASYQFTSERMRFSLANLFVDGSQDFLDPVTFEDEPVLPEYEFDQRHAFQSNRSSTAFEVDMTRRLIFGASANQMILRYDEFEDETLINLASERDRDEHALGASLGFRLVPSTTLFLTYAWSESIPQHAESFRKYQRDMLGIRLEKNPSRTFGGSLSVGYQRFFWEHEDVEDVEEITGDGALAMVLGDRVFIQLTGARLIYPSYWRNNTYFDRYGGGTSITIAASRSIRIGVIGGYYIHEYPNETTETLPSGDVLTKAREDELWQSVAFLQWTLGASHSIGARAGWTERTSNFDQFDRQGLILGGGYSIVY